MIGSREGAGAGAGSKAQPTWLRTSFFSPEENKDKLGFSAVATFTDSLPLMPLILLVVGALQL